MGVASNGYMRKNLYVVNGGVIAEKMPEQNFNNSDLQSKTILEKDLNSQNIQPTESNDKLEKAMQARMKGYEGDSCGDCGNFTLVRNGTCLKCDTCGSTSGCS